MKDQREQRKRREKNIETEQTYLKLMHKAKKSKKTRGLLYHHQQLHRISSTLGELKEEEDEEQNTL